MSIKDMTQTRTVQTSKKCPKCGAPMIKTIIEDTTKVTCYACKFKEIEEEGQKKVQQAKNQERFEKFKTLSLYSDIDLRNKTFKDFEAKNDEQAKGLQAMRELYKSFVKGKPMHGILSGRTGSGKSHLAMALCNELLAIDEPNNVIAFVNWREFYSEALKGMKFKDVADDVEKRLEELKRANFVVLDDVGAELTGSSKQEKTQDISMLLQILEARVNKPLLITTNQSSSEMQQAYGERAMSRILANMDEKTVVIFKDTKDYRNRLSW